jgi:site-specific recombinase XerD
MRTHQQVVKSGSAQAHVFTNGRGNAFSRGWLSLKMQRLRRRLGLAAGVTLYGLRHRYGLMGIKNGVNLKLLSLCMGHVRTQMTEHYIAEAGLTDQVQQAAWQVVHGPGMAVGPAPIGKRVSSPRGQHAACDEDPG